MTGGATQYSAAAQALGGAVTGPAWNLAAGGAAAAPAAGTGDPDQGLFAIPYPEQTGLTKYAPMQSAPPTKITAKDYTPLYPTSAYTIATTWLPPASIVTTITMQPTYSFSSMENTVRLNVLRQALLRRLIFLSGRCSIQPNWRYGQILGEMEGLRA